MAARITGDTLDALRERITPLDTPERRQRYLDRDFPRADQVCDLDTRYRWDLFHASQSGPVVYPLADDPRGLTDDHIDTALRTIVPALDTPAVEPHRRGGDYGHAVDSLMGQDLS